MDIIVRLTLTHRLKSADYNHKGFIDLSALENLPRAQHKGIYLEPSVTGADSVVLS